MKIKVRDKIYDGEKEPVMVILMKQDKKNIKNMISRATKYCMYPETFSIEEIETFMKIEEKEIVREKKCY